MKLVLTQKNLPLLKKGGFFLYNDSVIFENQSIPRNSTSNIKTELAGTPGIVPLSR